MTISARPLVRAGVRPLRNLQQPRHAQQALFSSSRSQQKLPGGTPGETQDPTEQRTPLGPYYESILVDPQPIPKTKPEAPPASSPKAPKSSASTASKAKDDAPKKATKESA